MVLKCSGSAAIESVEFLSFTSVSILAVSLPLLSSMLGCSVDEMVDGTIETFGRLSSLTIYVSVPT